MKKINYLVTPVLAVMVLAGCASDPIVDKRGVNPQKYEADLAECKSFAQEVNTAGEAAEHGAIGAAIGGAIGAIFGDSTAAGQGAGTGAILGSTEGVQDGERRKERVIHNCMRGRGYRVLG